MPRSATETSPDSGPAPNSNPNSNPDPTRDQAMDAALGMLARRMVNRAALHAKIAKRFGEVAGDRVVARLDELGLIDDAAFAEFYAEGRFERGGYGAARVRHELEARGVDPDVAEAAVSNLDAPGAERERAERWLARFFAGSTRDPSSEKDRAAAFRRLAARGYDEDLVCDLLGVSR